MTTQFFESAIGFVEVTGTGEGVSAITLRDTKPDASADEPIPEPVRVALAELRAYFAGQNRDFTFATQPAGTPFQQRVWQALREVPFGTHQSYMTLTRRLGDEKAIRAVAAANGRNPLAIVVPCHRIIGSNGSLTGYAGGLWRKQWLLEHEGIWPVKSPITQSSTQLSLF